MKPRHRLSVRRFGAGFFLSQAEPAGVEGAGAGERGGEVEGEVEAAEEFGGGDAAGAGGAAGVDGEAEGERFGGEATERAGVEVEARGGGCGFGVGVAGGGRREWKKRGLRGEIGDADLAEAWGSGRVDAGDRWRFGGGGKVES